MGPNFGKRKMEKNQEMMQGMKQNMMSSKQSGDFNPMEMCKQMQETMNQMVNMAGQQNPEVQAMFDEWSEEVEKEIISLLKEDSENNLNISNISEKLGISDESTLFFISKLIRDKKVQVTGLKVK